MKTQIGIVEENGRCGLFLVLKLKNLASDARFVAQACAQAPSLCDSVSTLDRLAIVRCVVGFGSEFWDQVSPKKRPKRLNPFRPIVAGNRKAPSTGGDILLHITANRVDLNYELAQKIVAAMGRDRVKILEEVSGFVYLDSRDLTGFIDGTMNPKGEERAEVALINSEDTAFAGGSYVLTQRYVHDLKKWAEISVQEQERVVGRAKRDSTELPPDQKPVDSHISRAEIRDGNEEFKIVRHSLPYGNVGGEAGLFFIAYAKDSSIFEKMLARMIGSSGDGAYDRLMDFSRPVSGALFFAPAAEMLLSFRT